MGPSLTLALKTVAMAKSMIVQRMLNERVGAIETAIDNLGKQLADDVQMDVRLGFTFPASAMSASASTVHNDELTLARGCFARLTVRSLPRIVAGTSQTLTADEVHALGHLGNYYYFLLRDQHRKALIAKYTCTERFPALGVQMSPPELFSEPYRSAGQEVACGQKNQLRYELVRKDFQRDLPPYMRAWAWKFTKASGALFGGLAVGIVSPPAAAQGLGAAISIMQGDVNAPPPYRPYRPPANPKAAENTELMKEGG